MYTILRPNDVDFNNIIYYKPIRKINKKYNISLYYNYNGKKIPLIIQTPKLYIPYKINEYGVRSSLDVLFYNMDDEQTFFYEFILKINAKIESLKDTKLNNFISDDCTYLYSIKQNKPFPDKLRFSIDKDTLVFDENKKIYSLANIIPKTNAKFLINFSDIWINKNNYGININILQILIFFPIKMKEFNFIDDEENILDNKYENMLKKGVSKMAVEHKMKMDGFNKSKKLFLGEITKGIKLNKTDNKNIPKKKVSTSNPHNLDEIINCRSKLRKI